MYVRFIVDFRTSVRYNWKQREDNSMKSFLLRCNLNKIPVEIMYISNNGQVSQRIISIKDINETTIRAYCHLRKTQRVFKVENILSINYKKAVG
jgi:predicted DNA-binding transcriptional regulator YafY